MDIRDRYVNICPTMYVIKLISGKWRIPIIWKINECGVIRYNELKREIAGITNTVLSQCLKELEEAHVIQRKQYDEIPLKVEYKITEEGLKLVDALDQIRDWGNMIYKNYPDLLK